MAGRGEEWRCGGKPGRQCGRHGDVNEDAVMSLVGRGRNGDANGDAAASLAGRVEGW